MKIYTKTGDTGTTSLFAGGRVSKSDDRLHAYGTIDELNAVLGMAIAHGLDEVLAAQVRRIQSELFTLGADLATPLDAKAERIVRMDLSYVSQLEDEIDAMSEELDPLTNFILPGGTLGAAALHQARTVCRRAERYIVGLGDTVNSTALVYVNRLADWLFMAARLANHRAEVEDPIWRGA